MMPHRKRRPRTKPHFSRRCPVRHDNFSVKPFPFLVFCDILIFVIKSKNGTDRFRERSNGLNRLFSLFLTIPVLLILSAGSGADAARCGSIAAGADLSALLCVKASAASFGIPARQFQPRTQLSHAARTHTMPVPPSLPTVGALCTIRTVHGIAAAAHTTQTPRMAQTITDYLLRSDGMDGYPAASRPTFF